MQVGGTHVRFYRPGIRLTTTAGGVYSTMAIAGRSAMGSHSARFLERGGIIVALLVWLYVIMPIISAWHVRHRNSRRARRSSSVGLDRPALATENGQQLAA